MAKEQEEDIEIPLFKFANREATFGGLEGAYLLRLGITGVVCVLMALICFAISWVLIFGPIIFFLIQYRKFRKKQRRYGRTGEQKERWYKYSQKIFIPTGYYFPQKYSIKRTLMHIDSKRYGTKNKLNIY